MRLPPASSRAFIAVAAGVLLAALEPACTKAKSFTLPELGDAELAFGALFDTSDRAVVVGPVVTRQRLKAGGYSVEATGELVARLFLVRSAALVGAAELACAALERRADQRACADLIASCRVDALPCLTVLAAGERCGERLELPKSLELAAFESDAGGKLQSIADGSAAAETLVLCGPVIEPPCPNVLPGYAITEDGSFRCTAPATQLGCAAELDLGGCGLGKVEGTIDQAGSFAGTVETPPCSIAPLESSDEVLGKREGAFAVSCGSRRFVATPMEILFAEPACTRRGPPVFNVASTYRAGRHASLGVGTGRVTGLKAFRPAGWSARYLFSGTGHDDCAVGGCDHFGSGCNNECLNECDMFVTLPDCAGANPWRECTGADTREECLARCRSACSSGRETCHEDAIGHALALAEPDAPEAVVAVVDLDLVQPPEEGPKQASGLALLGDRSTPEVAVASRRRIRVYRTQAIDTLTPLDSATRSLTFDLAGIAAVPGRPSELLAYGDDGEHGVLLRLQLTGETEPRLADIAPPAVSSLPTIDAIAAGGAEGTWIFAASTQPPLGAGGAGRIEVITIDGSEGPQPVEVPGRPTAIGSLPGGAIAVGVELAGGARDQLLILTPGAGGVSTVATLPLAGDLGLAVVLADPASCATQDRCRVYLGYRRRSANRELGSALVGILEFDRVDPSASRIVPSFVETASEELSLFELDTSRNELIAVASTQNRVTPITLW